MNHDIGVIYVATGERFLEMAARSAKSLKTLCPSLPIHIFTDNNIASYGDFDSSTKISDPHSRSKVDYIFKTPYQKTLFLDADTRVCEDIIPIFELLDRYDIAIAHEPNRRTDRMKEFPGSIPYSFAPLNSGVILFKKSDQVIEFFKNWKKTYHEMNIAGDQSSLRELIWLTDLKVSILPPEYNVRYNFYVRTLARNKITPKILHLDDFKDELEIYPEGKTISFRKRMKKKIIKLLQNALK